MSHLHPKPEGGWALEQFNAQCRPPVHDPAAPTGGPNVDGKRADPESRVRWHQAWWWRLGWGLLMMLMVFWTQAGDRAVDDNDYTTRWASTPINGTDGVCAVTTLGGNLDGHAKHLVGWRSTNLFPQTAKANIIDCSTGRPAVVDDLRLDQAWTDPSCSMAPDIDSYSRLYSPIRGNYADAASARGGPDGWWRIPNEACNRGHGVTGAIGIATATGTSSITAKPTRYRLVWEHRHFWQLGPVRSDQFCLAANVTVTIRLRGQVGSTNLPTKPVCVTSY